MQGIVPDKHSTYQDGEGIMQKQLLNEGWQMRECGAGEYMSAAVPGSVYLDLLNNGRIEDPFYRGNELKTLPLIDRDYEYRTVFDTAEELLDCDEVLLRFDGIDTLATIMLNGRVVGEAKNMHRVWEFPVKELLKPAGNELHIVFHSPTKFIAESFEENPIPGDANGMKGMPRLRKAHCMFGWDWAPRLPDAGLYRPVSLVGIKKARIDSVYIEQKHEDGRVRLTLTLEAETACEAAESCAARVASGGEMPLGQARADGAKVPLAAFTYRVTVTDPSGRETVYTDSPSEIVIEDPQIWWPNGLGAQPLYTVRVELLDSERERTCEETGCAEAGAASCAVAGESTGYPEAGGQAGSAVRVLDTWQRRIGLRTMSMHRVKDQYGETFAHEVNGVPFFGVGADYIPMDSLVARVDAEKTRRFVAMAKDANFNVLRVWGGGYYPDDFFYDACDEFGLVVWQDFMFACCVYDLTEEFEANITAEFIDNVKRIRHHASLGLWCGNNEMELFLADEKKVWCDNPIRYSDYVKMYEYLIPKALKKYDPQTYYWPASPSCGGGFDNPNDENRGDVHYWKVWHGGLPFSAYRRLFPRYMSEFGFESLPALKTVETFTEPEDRNIFSYVMEKHQRCAFGNGTVMRYMEQTYLYPTSLDMIIYGSQLMQAEAMRYGVEHFRRNRGRCMGAVIWQFNDCWPVASWAMVDYFGRWKAVMYCAKRFFAPLLLSCEEEGMHTQTPNLNTQPFDYEKSIRLCANNETLTGRNVTVRWQLRDASARILREESCGLALAPMSSTWLDKVELPDADVFENYVSYEMEENGVTVSRGTVLLCFPKYFHFRRPVFDVKTEGDELVISADCFAKGVWIRNGNDDMRLEDNYFDLNGETRRIKITEGKPEDITVSSVYDIR